MKILYIGYWSVRDGLSEATIRPHLQVLSNLPKITAIYYVSLERDKQQVTFPWDISKVFHLPYYSGPGLVAKLKEFYGLTRFLARLCQKEAITILLARSSPAGIYAYRAHKKTGMPFFVESFEPHAGYMRAAGVWSQWDPRYLLQAYYERKIRQHASGLLPVSDAYATELQQDSRITCPVIPLPCTVDLDKFKPNAALRQTIRQKLGFDNTDTVGIYVGKFGGLYLEKEAFGWFSTLKQHIPGFKLLILTGLEPEGIARQLQEAGFAEKDYFVGKVPHEEVPAYLNAADLAFCPVRLHEYSYACSPIKNGEYWACGLPVIIPDHIGDDSRILQETGLGVVVKEVLNLMPHLEEIKRLAGKNKREDIRQLAKEYRWPGIIQKTYEKIL